MNKRRRYLAKRRRAEREAFRWAHNKARLVFGGEVRVMGTVSEHVRLSAERFRRMFVPVPMTDAEMLPDPDYGF